MTEKEEGRGKKGVYPNYESLTSILLIVLSVRQMNHKSTIG